MPDYTTQDIRNVALVGHGGTGTDQAQIRPITELEAMAIQEQQRQTDDVDQAMLNLLGHRYGDGLVYLHNDREQQLYHEAVRLGLVGNPKALRSCIWL